MLLRSRSRGGRGSAAGVSPPTHGQGAAAAALQAPPSRFTAKLRDGKLILPLFLAFRVEDLPAEGHRIRPEASTTPAETRNLGGTWRAARRKPKASVILAAALAEEQRRHHRSSTADEIRRQ